MSNPLILFHNQGRGRPIGGGAEATYADKVLGYNPIAYWQLDESAGGVAADNSGNGFDGAYTGVTLGEDGIGDGKTAPLFDGANDFVDIYSVGFRDKFALTNHNGGDPTSEGTAMIWAKVFNVGVWTDGNFRAAESLGPNFNNIVRIEKNNVNNRMRWRYAAGGVAEIRDKNGVVETGWAHYAITWSKTSDEVRAYCNGVQEGATLTILGVWVGVLTNTTTVIGATNITATFPWYGYLAHCAVFDNALAPAAIADLAVVV